VHRDYLVDWSPLSASPLKDTATPPRNPPPQEPLVNDLIRRTRQLGTTCTMGQIQMHRSGGQQVSLLQVYTPMGSYGHCSDFSEGIYINPNSI